MTLRDWQQGQPVESLNTDRLTSLREEGTLPVDRQPQAQTATLPWVLSLLAHHGCINPFFKINLSLPPSPPLSLSTTAPPPPYAYPIGSVSL